MFLDFYKGKKVFITGHTGFKGSWLSHWLLALGAKVTGYSIGIPTEPSLFEALRLSSRMQNIKGDIRNFALLQKTLSDAKPDVVFHLAAQALVRESYVEPINTFSTNVMGSVHCLEAIRDIPSVCSVVYVTSDKCYENDNLQSVFTEDFPLGGDDPYSSSKGCAELVFRAYYRSFFKNTSKVALASARAGNVIGGGDWAKDRVIPDSIRSWVQKKPVLIRNPKSTRPWQFVLESLSGYLWLAVELTKRSEELSGHAFNFGPSHLESTDYSVLQLIQILSETWPKDKEFVIQEDFVDTKKEAKYLKLNSEKAWRLLNWSSVLDFTQAVRLTSEWYQSYYFQKKDTLKVSSEQIDYFHQSAMEKKLKWAIA